MNIFFLDEDPKLCAEYHCDKHVVKMILESAQIMSTVVRAHNIDAGYKATHHNHPCTLWAGDNRANYMWLYQLAGRLNDEYKFRFGRNVNHKSWDVIQSLPDPTFLPPRYSTITRPAMAMPIQYRDNDDPVKAYRNYYFYEKYDICHWQCGAPDWWIEMERDMCSQPDIFIQKAP